MEALIALLAGVLLGKSKITKTASTAVNPDGTIETTVTIDKNSTVKQAGDIIVGTLESLRDTEANFIEQIMTVDGRNRTDITREVNEIKNAYSSLIALKRNQYYGEYQTTENVSLQKY